MSSPIITSGGQNANTRPTPAQASLTDKVRYPIRGREGEDQSARMGAPTKGKSTAHGNCMPPPPPIRYGN